MLPSIWVCRAGDALFVIADFDPLLMRLYLPESEVIAVAVGQSVELRADRDSEVVAFGKVDRISPVVSQQSLTVEVMVSFEEIPPRMRPGSFGRVDIITRSLEDVLLVPRAAVLRGKGTPPHLFRVVESGRVQRLEVVTGYQDESVVQIMEGLVAGDLVVVVGHRELEDGTPVQVYREVPVPIDPLSVQRTTKRDD